MHKRLLLVVLVVVATSVLLFVADSFLDGPSARRVAGLESVAATPLPPDEVLPNGGLDPSDGAREPLSETVLVAKAADEPAPSADAILVEGRAEEVAEPESDGSFAEADYDYIYSTMSTSALQQEYDSLNEQVQETATRAYRAYFDTGRYEVVGYSTDLTSAMQDRNKLMAYEVVPLAGQEVPEIRRVELIETEYPEAYSLHRRAIRVFDLLRHKQRGGR